VYSAAANPIGSGHTTKSRGRFSPTWRSPTRLPGQVHGRNIAGISEDHGIVMVVGQAGVAGGQGDDGVEDSREPLAWRHAGVEWGRAAASRR
jgi:hypothetical protein